MSSAPFAVPDDHSTPYPVDMDRLHRVLQDMGCTVNTVVPDHAASAVFDDVPFLFTFDSQGRFLSVRTVWDTGLDPATCAPALFAAADGWNREKYFPTVYWMTSETGSAQVCADFVLDTRPGVTDVQLADNLDAGISTGITAIHYMKQAAGQALGWRPGSGTSGHG